MSHDFGLVASEEYEKNRLSNHISWKNLSDICINIQTLTVQMIATTFKKLKLTNEFSILMGLSELHSYTVFQM